METKEMKMNILEKFGNANDMKSIEFCREAFRFVNEQPEGSDVKKVHVTTEEDADCPDTPQVVDLGLPSGTLWCDRNVGAASPWDAGAFFSWGNTEPHLPMAQICDWGNAENAFAKPFNFDTYNKSAGSKVNSDLDLEHDAAHVCMGGNWKMPSDEQFQELCDNCTFVRKTMHGVNGYMFTSDINGNSIFFACSGYGAGTSWDNRGSGGHVWSSSFHSARNARNLYFHSGGVYPQNYSNRYYGFAVRPVQNKAQ